MQFFIEKCDHCARYLDNPRQSMTSTVITITRVVMISKAKTKHIFLNYIKAPSVLFSIFFEKLPFSENSTLNGRYIYIFV